MAIPRVERRLAAILCADVVGYSRLMGEDEEGTLRILNAYREVIDDLIGEHDGRVFGSAGDSVVAEFASAVQAVRCAMAIQHAIEDRNCALPDDQRMQFRIGINLGDVMVDHVNLQGDGVNVAARLEALAEPGGILISGTAFDHVEGKVPCRLEFLGEQHVKNIARSLRVYRVRTDSEAASTLVAAKPSRRGHNRWIGALAAGPRRLMAKAIRINPRYTFGYPMVVGESHFTLGQYQDAIDAFEEGLQRNPTAQRLRIFLAASYAQAGRSTDAQWQVAELLTVKPDLSLDDARRIAPYKNPEPLNRLLDGLRTAGLPQ